jgi:neutral ceramidase
MLLALTHRRRVLAGVVLLLLGVLPQQARGEDGWRAGAARVRITPEEPMWMAGYASRTQPAAGKYSDLWLKALVLEDAQQRRAVLLSFDLVGIDRKLAASLCRRLLERFGFERGQIALCFSHTHSGPVVGKNLEPLHYRQLDAEQQALVDRYARRLEQSVVECVGTAIDDLEPAELRWGSGTAAFAVNRRNNPADQVPALRERNALKGPHDHDVPVLAVRTRQGRLKAVAFGYACHATVLSDQSWCGDYPGYAEQALLERYPESTALFWAGCGADQNPLPRRQLELAKDYGRQLADAVSEVLAGEMTPLPARLGTAFREVPLKLDEPPGVEHWRQAAESGNRYEQARAQMLLERLGAGQPLPESYPYGVGVWTLGNDIQWVFLGGEVVVDYALRLKAERGGKRTWVAGYANDVMAYIPSLRVLAEGGYEGKTAMVYYGLPAAWAPGVEETVVDAVHALTAEAR